MCFIIFIFNSHLNPFFKQFIIIQAIHFKTWNKEAEVYWPQLPVQDRSQKRVSWELRRRRDGEREEYIQAKRTHVPNVPIEYQRDGHPDNNQQYRVPPQTGSSEEVQDWICPWFDFAFFNGL